MSSANATVSNNHRPEGKSGLSEMLRLGFAIAVPVALVLLTAYSILGVFESDYPRGLDFLAHLLKVESLNGSLDVYSHDWYDGWYGGYYQFTQYPFLSYLPAAALDGFGFSPLEAVKLEVFGATILAMIGMYLACRELLRSQHATGHTELAAAAGAVTFALSPAFLSVLFGRGELSDYVAMTLAPLSLFCLFRASSSESMGWWLACGVTLAVNLLLHPNVTVYVVGAIVIYLALAGRATKANLLGTSLAFVVMVGLSAFWLAPYFLVERETGFLAGRQGSSLNVSLTSLLKREVGEGTIWYIGVVPLALALIGLALPGLRRRSLPFVAFIAIGAIIASGWAAALQNNLPLLDEVDADNGLLLVLLGMAFLVTMLAQAFTSFGFLPYPAGLVLIALIVSDLSFGLGFAKSDYRIPSDFELVASYVATQQAEPLERVAPIGAPWEERFMAFLPSLSALPTSYGLEYQSSANSRLFHIVRYELLPSGRVDEAIAILDLFNVRYIIVDHATRRDDLSRLLASGRFIPMVESSQWTVLERAESRPPLRSLNSDGKLDNLNSQVTDYQASQVSFLATAEADASVVTPISWSPGWDVTVDGAKTAAWNHGGFVSFWFPHGQHTITMNLETMAVQQWARIFSAAFLVILTLATVVRLVFLRLVR